MDRGALDAALAAGFSCGGWCPQGKRAEDGKIPDRYPLEETRSAHYLDRTHRNVEDSDGTLIVARARCREGPVRQHDLPNTSGNRVLYSIPTVIRSKECLKPRSGGSATTPSKHLTSPVRVPAEMPEYRL